MLTQTDSRRRITLPPATGIKPGDTVEIEVLEDGRIMLIPVEPIPRHQLCRITSYNVCYTKLLRTASSPLSCSSTPTTPRPSQVGQAPWGELNEKLCGAGSLFV